MGVSITPCYAFFASMTLVFLHRNWGLTEHELKTIPPSLVGGFMKNGRGGFGADLPGNWGRLLMRGAANSDLYGPLQDEYLKGKELGTDVWIHKNRFAVLPVHISSVTLKFVYLESLLSCV